MKICLACGSEAKFREQYSRTRYFCNEECQLIGHFNENLNLSNESDNDRFLEAIKNNDIITLENLLATRKIALDNENLVFAAFRHAIRNQNDDIVEALLADDRITPPVEAFVHFAVVQDDVDMARRFFRREYYAPEVYFNVFLNLIDNGAVDMVELFLNWQHERFNPAENKNQAVYHALDRNDPNEDILVMLLRDPDINPMHDENVFLRIAIEQGREDIVELLLRTGRIDASAFENIALKLAILSEKRSIVEFLKRNIDPNSPGYTDAIKLEERVNRKDKKRPRQKNKK